jgi:hypothetical protein
LGQRFPAFFQHSFDRFLASSAILSHAAARINFIGALSTAADGSTDTLIIQPVADADDHPKSSCDAFSVDGYIAFLRMIVNFFSR